MPLAISVENVSKYYRLGLIGGGTLKADISRCWANFRGYPDPTLKIGEKDFGNQEGEFIWALRDVSFEVKPGEVVGIVGRNGAGKSTLLKVLSKVTAPTSGQVKIKGRIASLLEVGTGFHPELTGRENIFMNGAILGMTRTEIANKFDEIVEFSGVEKFIDTPVKRYSSGMYVRLAFAVAAHLDPEILIIDEVLAVGDIQFQKKCLGKMKEVSRGGRTILFVSHNLSAIEQLCTFCIHFEKGKLRNSGWEVKKLIKEYLFEGESNEFPMVWTQPLNDKFKRDLFTPQKMFLADNQGNQIQSVIRKDNDFWICLSFDVQKVDPALYFGLNIYSEDGQFLFGSAFTDDHPERWPTVNLGSNLFKCKLPKHLLNEGLYKAELSGGIIHKEWYFQPGINCPFIFFEIKGGLSDSPYWVEKRLGYFAPVLDWKNCS